MFDTVTIGGRAKLKAKFIHETTPWRAGFFIRSEILPDADLILGEWTWEVHRFAPGEKFGHKAIYKSVHRPTGIMVLSTQTDMICVSASLPRVLYGTNTRHFFDQSEVNQALQKMLDIVEVVADLRKVLQHWKFTRVDLTRPVAMPFAEFQRLYRCFRHPAARRDPQLNDNSIHFAGTNRALFCYDKGIKEDKVSDGQTRVELRLFKDALASEAYSCICGDNLSLSIKAAVLCFRDTLKKFPRRFDNPKRFPPRARFVAKLLLCEVKHDDMPFDVLSNYLSECYSNPESAARARRQIIGQFAQTKLLRIEDLICWDTPWPVEGKPSSENA